MNYKIFPKQSCICCHGTGTFGQSSEYWGFQVIEWITCDCVLDQLPEDYNSDSDDFEIAMNYDGLSGRIVAFDEWDCYEEDEDYLMACFDTD